MPDIETLSVALYTTVYLHAAHAYLNIHTNICNDTNGHPHFLLRDGVLCTVCVTGLACCLHLRSEIDDKASW